MEAFATLRYIRYIYFANLSSNFSTGNIITLKTCAHIERRVKDDNNLFALVNQINDLLCLFFTGLTTPLAQGEVAGQYFDQ